MKTENDAPKLYRIILQVPKMNQAVEFYTELLGVKGRAVHSSRTYFDCGPVILALVDPTEDGSKAKPNVDEIYFSVQDIKKMHERAKKLNCLSDEDVHGDPAGEIVTRPWRERSFYVKDPWGNRMCFVDEKTLFTGR